MTHIQESLPLYWDLLSEGDKKEYQAIRQDIIAANNKRAKNSKVDTFDGILETIRAFIEKGQEDDWKRYLVCGICWTENSIAINTRQLRILVSKCKSSINGSLQKMGYSTNTAHSESRKNLIPKIPSLKENFTELRQWTIRTKGEKTRKSTDLVIDTVPKPFSAHISPIKITCPLKFQQKLANTPQV